MIQKSVRDVFWQKAGQMKISMAFEFNCALPIGKCHGCFVSPWTKLFCVRHSAFIVLFQTLPQILREPDVEAFSVSFTLKNIDVEEGHPVSTGLPSRGSERFNHCPEFARLRASHFGAAVIALRCASSEDWRRRELNPRPWQINQPRLHA